MKPSKLSSCSCLLSAPFIVTYLILLAIIIDFFLFLILFILYFLQGIPTSKLVKSTMTLELPESLSININLNIRFICKHVKKHILYKMRGSNKYYYYYYYKYY